jgi:hypothetical protein
MTITENVETYFSENLKTNIPELEFFKTKGDSNIELPYAVVTSEENELVVPGHPMWRIKLNIVLLTSIDEASSQEHADNVEKIMEALKLIPRRVEREDLKFMMAGFSLLTKENATKDQYYADIITLLVGALDGDAFAN